MGMWAVERVFQVEERRHGCLNRWGSGGSARVSVRLDRWMHIRKRCWKMRAIGSRKTIRGPLGQSLQAWILLQVIMMQQIAIDQEDAVVRHTAWKLNDRLMSKNWQGLVLRCRTIRMCFQASRREEWGLWCVLGRTDIRG